MDRDIIIAIDAMGGDKGPDMVVAGLARAHQRHPSVRFLLCGDEKRLKPLVDADKALKKICDIKHADIEIAMDAKPSQALRQGRGKSGMWMALEAVRDGSAGACVSAGNTGALMAMAKLCLRMIEGIDRPAIAGVWPHLNGELVVLDLGANIEADARQLVEFALMGEDFARIYLNVENPRVALLNIGTEEMKGRDNVREAAALLSNSAMPVEFVGFIEGNHIFEGSADVIVTDGFTGNIALKTAEGTAQLIGASLTRALKRTFISRLGAFLAMGALRSLKERLDPRSANAGIFLGVNGIVVKSHGGTDAMGFAAAVDLAVELTASDLIGRIAADLARAQDIFSQRTGDGNAGREAGREDGVDSQNIGYETDPSENRVKLS